MNLAKTSVLSAANTAVRMVAGLVSVKAMAVFVGPTGVAYFGQFQSLVTFLTNVSNLGIGQGLIKYTAQHANSEDQLRRFFTASTLISLVGGLILALLIGIFAESLSIWLLNDAQYTQVFLALALAVIFYSLNQVFISILNGFKLVEKLVKARIVSALSGMILTLVLIYFFGLYGALYALIISQALGMGSLVYVAAKQPWFQTSNFFGKTDKKVVKQLLAFSLVSLSSLALLHTRQLYLRNYLIEHFSAEQAGYWQAMWKISEVYLMVITSALTMYYLPKLSELTDPKAIQQEIWKGLKLVMPILLTGTFLIYVFRGFITHTLFTSDFDAVTNLFLYQLIGDVLKIAAWMIGFVMIAKAMTKTFFITELIFISLFAVLAIALSSTMGLEGFTLAFAITYLTYLITLTLLFKDLLFKKNPTLNGKANC